MYKIIISVAILMLSIGSVSASILDVRTPSSTSTSLPVGYNPAPTEPAISFDTIAYGADLWGNGAFNYTFEYLGYEAGWTNYFISGLSMFNNKTTSIGSTISGTQLTSGWLDFSFQTPYGSVTNGSNNTPGGGRVAPNFFIAYDSTDLGVMFLGLNDDGSSIDADFDDLVVKITVSAVPEASSVYFLMFGLIGLLGMARRQR